MSSGSKPKATIAQVDGDAFIANREEVEGSEVHQDLPAGVMSLEEAMFASSSQSVETVKENLRRFSLRMKNLRNPVSAPEQHKYHPVRPFRTSNDLSQKLCHPRIQKVPRLKKKLSRQ